MTPLLVGTALALVALAFVLFPLFADSRSARPVPARPPASREPASSARAIADLREIEFDRATGKLSDSDYDALKAEYTRGALTAMRAEESRATVGDDEVEAAILKYRSQLRACAACGPRPEPDALYCSTCGRYLPGTCGACGAPVTEQGARFCERCGSTLAA